VPQKRARYNGENTTSERGLADVNIGYKRLSKKPKEGGKGRPGNMKKRKEIKTLQKTSAGYPALKGESETKGSRAGSRQNKFGLVKNKLRELKRQEFRDAHQVAQGVAPTYVDRK